MFSLSQKKPPAALGSPAANDKVRAELRALGDSGRTARHIIHYAYPADGTSKQQHRIISSRLRREGFRIKVTSCGQGLTFEHDQFIDGTAFDDITSALSKLLAGYNWRYDGWECALIVDQA